MRYNKLVLIFVALIGLTFSCQDAYDMRQPGEVNNPEDVYNTVDDLERGALGVYGAWTPITEIEFNSVFTDEVAIGRNNGGQGINDGLYTFILQAGSDAPAAIWGNGYAIINFANRILAAAENITPLDPADFTDEDEIAAAWKNKLRYERVIAEMKAIRAYAHFNLVSYFSENIANDGALGVMILDFVPDYNYETQLPRSTNGEVFAFIEQDLTDVENFFTANAQNIEDYVEDGSNPPVNWTTPKDRVSNYFVYALRARMNIYRERYNDALTYASKFVGPSNTPANSAYPILNTATAWASMLANTNDGEVIFKLRQIDGDPEVGALFNSQSSSLSGSPFYELSRSLYNLYLQSDGDIRKGGGVGTNIIDGTSIVAQDYESIGDYRNGDVLVINKYPGNSAQGNNLLNDFMIFRVGEMYLIKAEAQVGLGQLNGSSNSAAATLRRLRTYRGASSAAITFGSSTDAWAQILTERRKELALEGHRWLDIKRLGVKAGGLGVDRYVRDCQFYNACSLDPTSYKFTLPIPTSEIIANGNIAGQQNMGY